MSLDLRGSMSSGALFSSCGRYRYALWRTIAAWETPRRVLWVMLNPSTADEKSNDNTIRAVIRISKARGFSDIDVANLYGWRSTDPKGLKDAEDPIGPDNDEQIRKLATSASLIIAAWGAHAPWERGDEVAEMLKAYGDVQCLGITFGLRPKHPLFLRTDTPLNPYRSQHA